MVICDISSKTEARCPVQAGGRAEELLTARVRLSKPAAFGLTVATIAGATAAQASAVAQQQLEASSLESFETAAVRRLACGIVLAARQSSSLSIEITSLVDVFNAVGGAVAHMHEARCLLQATTMLTKVEGGGPKSRQAVAARLQSLGTRIEQSFDQVRAGLGDRQCPAELISTPTTVAAWCGLPPGHITATPAEVIQRTYTLYLYLLSQLATLARGAESPTALDPTAGRPASFHTCGP